MKHILLGVLIITVIACAPKESDLDSRPDIVAFSQTDAKMQSETINDFIARLPKLGTSVAIVKWAAPSTDGSREHIWVADVTFSDGNFIGILTNEPAKIAGNKAGDTVTFAQEDASDWQIIREDGRKEGGFTSKVMEEKTEASTPSYRQI